jgi:hypothetical protein
MNIPYKIEYTKGFCIFWGICFGVMIYADGVMGFAIIALMMLTLIHHEHAHAKVCEKLGIKINYIKFNFLGGFVNADVIYARDAAKVLAAGVINTGMYALAFTIPTFLIYYIKPLGLNFAQNPYLNFIDTMSGCMILFFLLVIIPVKYRHEKHGLITTDGYGVYLMNKLAVERDDELWNDGVRIALDQQRFFRVD